MEDAARHHSLVLEPWREAGLADAGNAALRAQRLMRERRDARGSPTCR
jgi:hypothetical protein